jgi:molybdate transport system substrate-binding protein
MSTLSIMSALAVRGAFESVMIPDFERNEVTSVRVHWDPTTALMAAIDNGEIADVCVLTDEATDALAQRGVIDPSSIVPIAQSILGLGVLAGQPKPDISTLEKFIAVLLSARSVAYSRQGASGIYFEKLIERLGIAEAIRSKATVIPAGFTAERLLTGEADIAVQQTSELMVVKGTEIVGLFPPGAQSPTNFCAAIMQSSTNKPAAERFIRTLTGPRAAGAYEATGLIAAKA